jgi:cell division protein FtsB
VLVVLVYLYVSAGLSLLGSWSVSRQDSARLSSLERANASLEAERARLKRGYEGETQARMLGMARPGEKLFIVKHLPRN